MGQLKGLAGILLLATSCAPITTSSPINHRIEYIKNNNFEANNIEVMRKIATYSKISGYETSAVVTEYGIYDSNLRMPINTYKGKKLIKSNIDIDTDLIQELAEQGHNNIIAYHSHPPNMRMLPSSTDILSMIQITLDLRRISPDVNFAEIVVGYDHGQLYAIKYSLKEDQIQEPGEFSSERYDFEQKTRQEYIKAINLIPENLKSTTNSIKNHGCPNTIDDICEKVSSRTVIRMLNVRPQLPHLTIFP